MLEAHFHQLLVQHLRGGGGQFALTLARDDVGFHVAPAQGQGVSRAAQGLVRQAQPADVGFTDRTPIGISGCLGAQGSPETRSEAGCRPDPDTPADGRARGGYAPSQHKGPAIHRIESFVASERLIGRFTRQCRAHPYLAGSLAFHGLLAMLLAGMPGLGEGERAHAAAVAARLEQAGIAQTEDRLLRARVERMAEIRRVLDEAAGRPGRGEPGLANASLDELAARARSLASDIEAARRRLQEQALAQLAGISLEQARRELDERAVAEAPEPAASSPAEAIERLEQRAREALESQRAQLQARREGVPVSTGQERPADGIPRSLAVQLAAEFRNGPPQGKVGEPGVEGGRSINPWKVEGVAGGRDARDGDQQRSAATSVMGVAAPVRVPGGSLDLTGAGGNGEAAAVHRGEIDLAAVRTGAGRVIGAGGTFANRVYLDSWYVIGPFEARGEDALETVYPPEENVDLEGSYRGEDGRLLTWRYASRGFYPFIPPDRAERAVYYAYTELRLQEGRDLWLSLAADDDSMLWLDGRLVWRSERRDKPWYRPPYYLPDEQVASLALAEGERKVRLEAGVHRLLLKLYNDRDRTFFSVVAAP